MGACCNLVIIKWAGLLLSCRVLASASTPRWYSGQKNTTLSVKLVFQNTKNTQNGSSSSWRPWSVANQLNWPSPLCNHIKVHQQISIVLKFEVTEGHRSATFRPSLRTKLLQRTCFIIFEKEKWIWETFSKRSAPLPPQPPQKERKKKHCVERFCCNLRYRRLVWNLRFKVAINNETELNVFKRATAAPLSDQEFLSRKHVWGEFETQREVFSLNLAFYSCFHPELGWQIPTGFLCLNSWISARITQKKKDDPLFTACCKTDVIGGHSVSNKDVSLWLMWRIDDIFILVSNGCNGWLTNGVAFIGVIGAVGLAVAEPGLGDAGLPVATVKLPCVTQDGV